MRTVARGRRRDTQPMAWRHIMFAVASPGRVEPVELRKIAQLAAGLEAEVELFHCAFDPGVTLTGRFGSPGAREDIDGFVALRREQLECSAERLRATGTRVRTSIHRDYPAYEGIVRQVLRHRSSLLVAQSTAKGRAERWVRSHTDYRLIETCPCPLLFIKNNRPYFQPVVLAAVDPEHLHEKPASLDEEILAAATRMCGVLKGSLRVFHAGVPWAAAARDNPELEEVPTAVREEVRAAYRRGIEVQVEDLARRHNVPQDAVRVIEGDAAELLPGVVRREAADIVTLGAVSRSRLTRALIGHTAERVFDAMDCDLLVVKPPEFRTRVRPESVRRVEGNAAP
jgi:universal stress protein E